MATPQIMTKEQTEQLAEKNMRQSLRVLMMQIASDTIGYKKTTEIDIRTWIVVLFGIMVQDRELTEARAPRYGNNTSDARNKLKILTGGADTGPPRYAYEQGYLARVEKGRHVAEASGAFGRYLGMVAKLAELEKKYPAVSAAGYIAMADLSLPQPTYFRINPDGTVGYPGQIPPASAESSAVTGAVIQVPTVVKPSSSSKSLGVVMPEYLRTAFAEAGIPESAYPAMLLKEQSEREKGAAADLAKAVQAQQNKERGPMGGTPVAPLVRKPPPVKTPVKPAKPPKYTGKKK